MGKLRPDGGVDETKLVLQLCDESFRERIPFEDNITFVGIASDGLNSFVHKVTGNVMPLAQVIRAVTAIKSIKGCFLQRRMRAQLKAWSADWYHYDDLGIACFAIDHE